MKRNPLEIEHSVLMARTALACLMEKERQWLTIRKIDLSEDDFRKHPVDGGRDVYWFLMLFSHHDDHPRYGQRHCSVQFFYQERIDDTSTHQRTELFVTIMARGLREEQSAITVDELEREGLGQYVQKGLDRAAAWYPPLTVWDK